MTHKKDPAARRKAAERQRLRAQGLRPMEVWVYPQHKQAVKEYVKSLQKEEPAHILE
jgi:hypothetical protein